MRRSAPSAYASQSTRSGSELYKPEWGYLNLATALLALDVQGKWYRGVCRRVRSRLERSDDIGLVRSCSARGSVVRGFRLKYMSWAWSGSQAKSCRNLFVVVVVVVVVVDDTIGLMSG